MHARSFIRTEGGFTLTRLIVVLLLIGVVAVVIWTYSGIQEGESIREKTAFLMRKLTPPILQGKNGEAVVPDLTRKPSAALKETTLGQHGPVIDVRDRNGQTLLMWSVVNGHIKFIEFFLNWKADINAQDNEGKTALHLATQNNNVEAAKSLLNFKANPNLQDKEGRTPLMLACLNGSPKIAELLISKGADLKPKDKERKTALDISQDLFNRHQEIVKLMKK